VPSPVAELLADLGAGCGDLGIRWYLFGAQAAIIHGSARLTGDVDVTVDLGSRDVHALVGSLCHHGFELRVQEVDAFAERTGVLPFLHLASGIPVDVVLAGPGIEEMFLSRAEQRTVENVCVSVARVEDVVAMKILAGRPKDLEDAAAMLAARGAEVDRRMIRSTLRLLERALDQSDLLPQLERLLRRAARRR
jgi:hypothetical protein